MKITEAEFRGTLPIDGYGPGFFRIAGEVRRGPQLVWGAGVADWAGYDDPAALIALADRVDVVFVGTGADIAHPPAAFRAALEAAGVAWEPMATGPAARTYNVLLSEGRRVAAALLAV